MSAMLNAMSDAATIAKRNVIKIKRVPRGAGVRAAVADHVRAVVRPMSSATRSPSPAAPTASS